MGGEGRDDVSKKRSPKGRREGHSRSGMWDERDMRKDGWRCEAPLEGQRGLGITDKSYPIHNLVYRKVKNVPLPWFVGRTC